jgi:hypothetical protein
MPDIRGLLPYEPSRWCSNTCPGAESHEILDFFASRFRENTGNGNKLTLAGVEGLDDKLTDLSTALYKASCSKLYAHAIHVSKLSAFLDIENGKNFVERLYGIIQKVWNNGYSQRKVVNTKKNQADDDSMFDPSKLLDGWIRDLPLVKDESLSIYLQILACDGLSSQPKFREALEAFQGHLLKSNNPRLIDVCGESLVSYILEPLLKENHSKVIELLLIATNIAVAQVSDDNFESIKALRRLVEHLKKKQGNGISKSDKVYVKILAKLSETFIIARNGDNFNLCQELGELIPLIGGWKRDRRLKTSDKLNVQLRFSNESQIYTGVVKDIDQNGYYYIKFDDLSEAKVIKGSKRDHDIKKDLSIPIVDLYVKNNQGTTWKFNKASAIFSGSGIPSGEQQILSTVYPIRGWQYKHSYKGNAGAVVWVETPPIKNLKNLVPIVAMEGSAEENDEIEFKNELKTGVNTEASSGTMFEPGPEGLTKGIKEFFEDFSNKILLERRQELFWNKKNPVTEKKIDLLIRPELERYVKSRGGNLTYQEDVGLGRCDYVISRGDDNLVIELKRSVGNWKQGIKSELPTLMTGKKTNYGIFLIFTFHWQFGKKSKELRELRMLRYNTCKPQKVHIDIVLISCDKQKSASHLPKTPCAGEGFQYDKWDSESMSRGNKTKSIKIKAITMNKVRNSKQAKSSNNTISSDCVIFAKEKPSDTGVEILHVSEGISYHPDDHCVKIHFTIISRNSGTKPVRFRVIHRGKTTACLQKFSFSDTGDPRRKILSSLFDKWIKKNPDDDETVFFHKRVNCVGVDPEPVIVSLSGPGRCFEKMELQQLPLTPEIQEMYGHPSFSSYLIPPRDYSEMKPDEITIWTMKLKIEEESYLRFVNDGSEINVNSYTRLMRDIETYDLPNEKNKQLIRLYEDFISSKNSTIEPTEYDIVIFQQLGQSLILRSNSISATPVCPSPSISEKEAICFFGQPKEFSLRLSYPENVIKKQKELLQPSDIIV